MVRIDPSAIWCRFARKTTGYFRCVVAWIRQPSFDAPRYSIECTKGCAALEHREGGNRVRVDERDVAQGAREGFRDT